MLVTDSLNVGGMDGLSVLADNAIKLGKTSSEIGMNNIIIGVFLILFLLMFTSLFSSLHKLTKDIGRIAECSTKTMVYFTDKLQKEINLDQARSIITEQVNEACSSMKVQVMMMRSHDDLDDRDEILVRINNYIYNTYNKRQNHFKKFEYNEKVLAKILVPNRNAEASKLMIELVYSSDACSLDYITRRIDEFYTTIKSDYNTRLDSL